MAYTITSDRLDSPKKLGDSITEEELLTMGANIEALVDGGHISDAAQATPAPQIPATPATPEGATE
jgi:hypothetical protein